MAETVKTKPTDTQIDVLMSDWLGNLRMKAEGNYTHKGKGGIKRKKKTSFRQYLLGDVKRLDNLDLIKQSRIAAEKIVNTVTPNMVSIQVGQKDSFNGITPDGREIINLATDYFDDATLSNEEKCDIMLGLATHEASHSAYTDNELAEKETMKEHADLRKLKHSIFNIIEDERIEYHLGEDRPGLVECIGATKGYYFDKLVNRMKTDGKMPTESIPKLLNAITQAVRYPSEMTREQVEENFDDLDAVRRILTPFPLTSEQCWEATERVMGIIRDKAEEQLEQKQKQEGKKKENESSSSQEDGPSSGGGSTGEEKKPSSGKKNKKPSQEEIRKAIKDALSTKEGQNVMAAIEHDEKKGDSNNASQSVKDGEGKEFVNDDDSERMSSSTGAGTGNPDTFVRKPKGNPDSYNRTLKNVRPYVPAMARALTCRSQETDYVMRSQPRGKLDTNKLVAYKAGSENIFRKTGEVKCSSASVCILIDESGSMSGQLKLAAREAAILVNEAVKRIRNVNFYCYGFTSHKLNVYSENGRTSPWALSETGAYTGTPTGKSMFLASKRIRKFTNDPVLMLVMTDGCADNSTLVIEQDNKLRKQGFIPVGVGIMTNAVENTFKEHLVMDDISTFAIDMAKLTKGKLEKMLVRTDSNA